MHLLVAIGLVTLSIFIHELGHFLMARARGMVVPRFSIFGIGKPIVAWKWRGVEYCICWLPIGAYVMVPQLSDLGDFEGDVPESARNLPPASYLSKVLVAIAGPAANLLFALALACVVWSVGVQVPAEYNRTEIGEIARELQTHDGKTVPGPAAAAGLQPGDIIRKIDGKPVANFQDIVNTIIFGARVTPDGRRLAEITFERNGATLTREIYPELISTERFRTIGIAPRSDLIVEKVNAGSAAEAAGLLAGDRIIAIDGKPLSRRDELREYFQTKHAETSLLLIKRAGAEVTKTIQPRLQTVQGQTLYLIGITWHTEMVLVHKDPLTQIGEIGVQMYQTFSSLLNHNSDIRLDQMQSIVGMVDNLQQAAATGLIPTLLLLMLINVALATFNLLPIPVLDGGHIAIATLAKLRGKSLNPALLQNAVAACFVVLIGLIVYVSYNDIRRVIQYRFDEPPAKAAPARQEPAKPAEPEKPAEPAKP